MASSISLLLALSLLFISSNLCAAKVRSNVPLVKDLSYNFHHSSCPNLGTIVRNHLKKVFKEDVGQAAGLLRLHFHDCFVQGCDASVLLDGSASGPSEQQAPPNLSLRSKAFEIIDDLRELLHDKCGRVVSCADIAALAARDAVHLSGGPDYEVPLGRRDGLNFATTEATLDNLPAPSSSADVILKSLATKNLDATDVVALSGGHTIGISHCSSFTERLYPTEDPTMDEDFAKDLKYTCPPNSSNTTPQDVRTPNLFDNNYFVDLIFRQGLFTSDQDLFTNKKTREIVKSFAFDQELFFEKFVHAMTKMGQLNVLVGNQGEIRGNCSSRNSDNQSYLKSNVVDESKSEL